MVKRRAPAGREFYLADGAQVSTIEELYTYLKQTSDDEFKKHVHGNRNDFASWVKNVHGKTFLAKDMGKVKTRKSMVNVLGKEIKKYEELEKRATNRKPVAAVTTSSTTTALDSTEFITKEFVFGLIFGLVLGLLLAGVLNALG